MRNYIRHPSDIPIHVLPAQAGVDDAQPLNDISHGGLSFYSRIAHVPGVVIRLKIPLVTPVFEAPGKVVWCRASTTGFIVGIEFLDSVDMFRARMVEQICHIEHYKKTVRANEGRTLSSQEAALEWIGKYAEGFPLHDDNTQD